MGREPNGNAKDKISKEKDFLLGIRIIPISGKMKNTLEMISLHMKHVTLQDLIDISWLYRHLSRHPTR